MIYVTGRRDDRTTGRTAHLFSTVVLFVLFVLSPESVHAATIYTDQPVCCLCTGPGDTKNTCLTTTVGVLNGTLCDPLPGKIGKTLDGWTCTRNLDTPNQGQCRPVSVPGGVCQNGIVQASAVTNPGALPTESPSKPPEPAILPNLGVPIPNFEFVRDPTPETSSLLAQYIAGTYQFMISIAAVAATVMFTWGAFLYLLGSANLVAIARGKQIMIDAIVGLLLVFGANLILRTINPATLTFGALNITPIKPERAIHAISGPALQQLFGGPPPDRRRMLALGKEIAAKTGIPELPCIVYASMTHESGGRMDVIGHDENFTGTAYAVRARTDFLTGGKTYKGATFAPVACPDRSCQSSSQQNDDISTFDPLRPPDYGIDWRYSHGFGASQSTIFPNSAVCPGRDAEGRGFRMSGKCYTVLDLMKPETNVTIMVDHFKSVFNASGKDVAKTFVAYAGQGIAGGVNNPAIVSRMEAYAKCRAVSP